MVYEERERKEGWGCGGGGGSDEGSEKRRVVSSRLINGLRLQANHMEIRLSRPRGPGVPSLHPPPPPHPASPRPAPTPSPLLFFTLPMFGRGLLLTSISSSPSPPPPSPHTPRDPHGVILQLAAHVRAGSLSRRLSGDEMMVRPRRRRRSSWWLARGPPPRPGRAAPRPLYPGCRRDVLACISTIVLGHRHRPETRRGTEHWPWTLTLAPRRAAPRHAEQQAPTAGAGPSSGVVLPPGA